MNVLRSSSIPAGRSRSSAQMSPGHLARFAYDTSSPLPCKASLVLGGELVEHPGEAQEERPFGLAGERGRRLAAAFFRFGFVAVGTHTGSAY